MKKTTKWFRFISILAISLSLLFMSCYVTAMAISYLIAQDNIRYHEEVASQIGWTDSSVQRCEEIRAEQYEMAEAHPLYRWMMHSSQEPISRFLRNVLLLANLVICLGTSAFIYMLVHEFIESFRRKPSHRKNLNRTSKT